MKVPFGTLNVQDRSLINKVLDSGWLTQGKMVEEFETEFAKLFGTEYAIATSTGTDALAICCAILPIGSQVICPALTFIASANAILQAGLRPVFVDVTRNTLSIDVTKIEEALTANTKAIMAVHLMGKPCDMEVIMSIAKEYDLAVIEDCCEAHGARYSGQLVGTFGNAGCYSLYASHIVSSIEGGMIVSSRSINYKSLRNHGISGKFQFNKVGFSAKMNEIEAAIGIGNLRNFNSIMGHRRRNFEYLSHKMSKFEPIFIMLKEEEHEFIAPHAFSIIVRDNVGFTKDELVKCLDEAEIDSRNLFYSIPTQVDAYKDLYSGTFPEAEFCSDNGIHIGIHQDLTINQLDYVVETIEKFTIANRLRVPQTDKTSI